MKYASENKGIRWFREKCWSHEKNEEQKQEIKYNLLYLVHPWLLANLVPLGQEGCECTPLTAGTSERTPPQSRQQKGFGDPWPVSLVTLLDQLDQHVEGAQEQECQPKKKFIFLSPPSQKILAKLMLSIMLSITMPQNEMSTYMGSRAKACWPEQLTGCLASWRLSETCSITITIN